MMYYTYLHRRASDGTPFYVGKGKDRRAWVTDKRSSEWKLTKSQHGLLIEILAYWPTEDEALEHERLLISSFIDMGYKLCNKNKGGAGNSGFIMPESAKIRMAKAKLGRLNPFFGKNHTPEMRRLISLRFKGKKLPDEQRKNVSTALKTLYEKRPHHRIGTHHSEETKSKISRKSKITNLYRAIPVVCIETGKVFPSASFAADWLKTIGIANPLAGAIRECSAGNEKRKTIYGYHWSRA